MSYLLLAYFGLLMVLLSGCATYHRAGDNVSEDPNFCEWEMIAIDQRVMFGVAELKGNSYIELLPGDHYFFQTPRQDELQLKVKYWEENGWSSDERLLIIKRTGQWSGVQKIILDDFLLNNAPRLTGFFVNIYDQPIEVLSYRGYTDVGRLNVGQHSQLLRLTPGKVTIKWRSLDGNHHETKVEILNNHHRVEFDGQMVDWYIQLGY